MKSRVAEVGDRLPLEGALVVEVEVLQRLPGWEAGGADAALAAVGLAGGDLALQAGGQELLMRPGLGAGSFGQPLDRGGQRRGLERPGQVGHLAGDVAAVGAGLGGHQAISSFALSARPNMRS